MYSYALVISSQIRSREVQDYIKNQIDSGDYNGFWIGAYGQPSDGTFRWHSSNWSMCKLSSNATICASNSVGLSKLTVPAIMYDSLDLAIMGGGRGQYFFWKKNTICKKTKLQLPLSIGCYVSHTLHYCHHLNHLSHIKLLSSLRAIAFLHTYTCLLILLYVFSYDKVKEIIMNPWDSLQCIAQLSLFSSMLCM